MPRRRRVDLPVAQQQYEDVSTGSIEHHMLSASDLSSSDTTSQFEVVLPHQYSRTALARSWTSQPQAQRAINKGKGRQVESQEEEDEDDGESIAFGEDEFGYSEEEIDIEEEDDHDQNEEGPEGDEDEDESELPRKHQKVSDQQVRNVGFQRLKATGRVPVGSKKSTGAGSKKSESGPSIQRGKKDRESTLQQADSKRNGKRHGKESDKTRLNDKAKQGSKQVHFQTTSSERFDPGSKRRHQPKEHSSPPVTPPPNRQGRPSQPRMQDQTPASYSSIQFANTYYRIRIATRNAFPDLPTRSKWAAKSFKAACKKVGTAKSHYISKFTSDTEYADSVRSIVEQRGAQLRGEVKTCAENLVIEHYKLPVNARYNTAATVQDEIERLTTDGAFIAADPGNKSNSRRGIYEHPCIQAVYSTVFFKDRNSEGVLFQKAFKCNPPAILALVVTAIHCSLAQWETGEKRPSSRFQFSEATWGPIYETHLKCVKDLKELRPERYKRLMDGLFTKGLAHSGALITTKPKLGNYIRKMLADEDEDVASEWEDEQLPVRTPARQQRAAGPTQDHAKSIQKSARGTPPLRTPPPIIHHFNQRVETSFISDIFDSGDVGANAPPRSPSPGLFGTGVAQNDSMSARSVEFGRRKTTSILVTDITPTPWSHLRQKAPPFRVLDPYEHLKRGAVPPEPRVLDEGLPRPSTANKHRPLAKPYPIAGSHSSDTDIGCAGNSAILEPQVKSAAHCRETHIILPASLSSCSRQEKVAVEPLQLDFGGLTTPNTTIVRHGDLGPLPALNSPSQIHARRKTQLAPPRDNEAVSPSVSSSMVIHFPDMPGQVDTGRSSDAVVRIELEQPTPLVAQTAHLQRPRPRPVQTCGLHFGVSVTSPQDAGTIGNIEASTPFVAGQEVHAPQLPELPDGHTVGVQQAQPNIVSASGTDILRLPSGSQREADPSLDMSFGGVLDDVQGHEGPADCVTPASAAHVDAPPVTSTPVVGGWYAAGPQDSGGALRERASTQVSPIDHPVTPRHPIRYMAANTTTRSNRIVRAPVRLDPSLPATKSRKRPTRPK